MPYCFMTLVLLGLSVILAMITLALEGKRRVAFGVGTVAAVIGALISFATMSIPKPEIYTTNGNSVEDNELYQRRLLAASIVLNGNSEKSRIIQ